MKTILRSEQVFDDWQAIMNGADAVKKSTAGLWCERYSTYRRQFEDGRWNDAPPSEQEMKEPALKYSEDFFGVDGHVAHS